MSNLSEISAVSVAATLGVIIINHAENRIAIAGIIGSAPMTGGALIRFGKISFFSQGTGALKYEATVRQESRDQAYFYLVEGLAAILSWLQPPVPLPL